jgi:hypothetical protein
MRIYSQPQEFREKLGCKVIKVLQKPIVVITSR